MPIAPEQTDGELLNRAIAGDEAAFATLYRRRSGPIYRFALRLGGVAAVAEEVTQEVFLMLVREPLRFDERQGSLAAFLFGVARNLALRKLDRRGRFVPLEHEGTDIPVHENLIDRRDPHDALDRSERIARVRRAVLALPEHYRDVVVLCDLEEVSYAEAAEALGCSVGTVRSRLHRGRSLLIDKLEATERGADSAGAAARRCYV